jgi:hypothetical protein
LATKDKPIWVRWRAKDALDGMAMLSPLEEVAYRRILDMIFVSDDRLEDNDRSMAWATKAGRQWKAIKKRLLDLGKISVEDGFIRNTQATEACTESRSFIAQKVIAGQASAEARKALKDNESRATDVDTPATTDVGTGVPTNHNHIEGRERESPPTESVTPAREDQPRERKRRVVLGRFPSAAAWRKFSDCESEADGPMARTRPCIRARPGIPGVDPDIQKYPLDDHDGLPNEVFGNTLIAYNLNNLDAPIDWTPLFEWVHDGVSRETILEAIETANEGYKDRLERYPSRTTAPRGLGFYDRTVRRLAGLLSVDDEAAA